MSDEWLDEKISCEYCGTELKLKYVKDWLKLSEVTQNKECSHVYFCSHECLKSWFSRIRENMIFALFEARMRDKAWLEEEKRIYPH